MRILTSILIACCVVAPIGADGDPFAFFQPTVTLTPADRETLAGGAPVVHFLPASGPEVGAFTAIAVGPEVSVRRAAAWMRQAELLRENRYVIASQRLSVPPRLSDFDRIVLDDGDLEAIRRCLPGRCGVKLAAADIEALTRVAVGGGDWKRRLQRAFREMLLQRALTFAGGGLPALDAIVDKKQPSIPAEALMPLVNRSAFLGQRLPAIAGRLARCAPQSSSASFMYWSQERLGGRPVVTLTHATVITSDEPGRPPLLMLAAQVYASHYIDASLTITALVRDEAASQNYFVYLHRSNVDLLRGLWGGIARAVIESKVRKDGPAILRFVGRRLASGEPPLTSTRHAGPSR
jgi:hypothetical protein